MMLRFLLCISLLPISHSVFAIVHPTLDELMTKPKNLHLDLTVYLSHRNYRDHGDIILPSGEAGVEAVCRKVKNA